MSEQTQDVGALIVNTWSVQDGLQDEFLAGLTDLLEHVRTVAGFLHGQILQGANTTRYISVVVMRSTLERDRALEEPETRRQLRELRRIARADAHGYVPLRQFVPIGDTSA
jgi:heme-degrading monooxygenase HmoA